jgi:hypothetical protein
MSSHDAKSRQGAELGLGRELFGLFASFCGLLFVLSLATFDSRDPWINHVVSGVTRVHNKAGLFGSYLAGFFYDLFGIGSWTAPACLCLAGARRILGRGTWVWWRWTGFFLLGLCMCLAGAASDLGDVEIFAKGAVQHGAGNVSTHGGGIAGQMLYVGMVGWMSSTGTGIVWLFCLLLALQMLTGISWIALLAAAGQALWRMVSEKARAASAKRAEGRDFRLVRSQERAERILTVSAQRPPPGALRLPGPASPADPAGNAARPSALSPGCEQKIGEDDSDMVSPLPRAVPFSAPIGSGIGDSSGIAPVFFEAGENFSRHPAENPASPEQEERPEPSPQARGRNEGSGPLPFRESTSPASASRRAREEKKEEDLPPWLHDFEEERLGAPLPSLFPTTPSEPSLPEDAAGARRNAGQKDLPPTEQNREEIPLMRGSVIADAPHGADGTPDPDAEPAGPDEGKAADAVGRSASDREATAPGAAFPEARVPVPPVLSSSDKDRDADEGVPEKDPAIASAEPMSDRAASLRVEPGAPAQEPPDRSSEKEPDRIPILAIPPVEAAPQAPDSGLLHSVLLLT